MGSQNHLELESKPEPGVLTNHPAASPALQQAVPPGSPEHWVRKKKNHIGQMFILTQTGTKQGRPGCKCPTAETCLLKPCHSPKLPALKVSVWVGEA